MNQRQDLLQMFQEMKSTTESKINTLLQLMTELNTNYAAANGSTEKEGQKLYKSKQMP
jgi:hypothetical protein